ncbi:MAG: hypothetical protein HDR28_09330 [Lachnospiraceae bacterium]|nr:hypothetical protein [Lachnospiraceae bacterium]
MNRLNWIQQEQKTADYHVLTWRTSHFHHPRNRTDIVGQVGGKFDLNGGAASSGAQQQADGIGLGLADPAENILWKTGGLGADGMAEDGTKTAKHQEVMDSSDQTAGRHMTGMEQPGAAQQIMTAAQTIVPEEVYSVVNSARQSVLKVCDRVKQGTEKLRDLYQKQQKQAAHAAATRKGEYRKPSEKERQGTRKCDKDDMLSMQAQNHYLLDSYDRNGQYSMLGK